MSNALMSQITTILSMYEEIPDVDVTFDQADDALTKIRDLVGAAPDPLPSVPAGSYPLWLDVNEKALARAVQFHQTSNNAEDGEVVSTAEKFRAFLATSH